MRALAKDLVLAADKYDMPEFATICESEIKNACSVSLKKFCLDFMKQSTAAVYKSDVWKKLKEASIELAMEVMESVVQ